VPTYSYVCRDCGHRFDAQQPIKDAPLSRCPQCGGSVRKLISVPFTAFTGGSTPPPCAPGGGCCGPRR